MALRPAKVVSIFQRFWKAWKNLEPSRTLQQLGRAACQGRWNLDNIVLGKMKANQRQQCTR